MKTKILFALAYLLSSPALAQNADQCNREAIAKKWPQVRITQCVNQAQRADLLTKFPADLVDYFESRSLAISDNIDRGRVTQLEGAAQIRQIVSQVVSESQRRAALTQQTQQSQSQSQSRGTVTYCLNGPSTICF